MTVRVVVGSQWGDEGKGKIVDVISEDADIVARYQGGGNAGHTIVVGDLKLVLHYIPSCVLRENVAAAIGAGVVLNPKGAMNEIANLESIGVSLDGRFYIDNQAHLILPYHRIQDFAEEWEKKKEGKQIGTTGHGIGSAYADQAGRTGIRFETFVQEEKFVKEFREKLEDKILLFMTYYALGDDDIKEILKAISEKQFKENKDLIEKGVLKKEDLDYNKYYDYKKGLSADAMLDGLLKISGKLKPYAADVSHLINEYIAKGKNVLLEGAQGTYLDKNYGTYPFVTSSNPIAASAALGVGIGPGLIDEVIGIMKAYITRVGEGPFPTRFDPYTEEIVRKAGGEFGATTGRPRKCGYFDGVMARRAMELNHFTYLAVTKLDVLSVLDEIPVCFEYVLEGRVLEKYPTDVGVLEKVTPLVDLNPGWGEDISNVTDYDELPDNAKLHLERMLSETKKAYNAQELKIKYVSVGEKRGQIIRL